MYWVWSFWSCSLFSFGGSFRLASELSFIKEEDVKVKMKELGVISASIFSGIVDACKKVGKPTITALSSTVEIAEISS
jgi:hypothetical protein